MTPRFEFRIFGDELPAERRALEDRGVRQGEEARTDTYFVVPGRADASLKLRGDKLDLKLLRGRQDGLELWEPAAETGFPTAAGELRDRFLRPAGVVLDLPEALIDGEKLLALARASSGVSVVRVGKNRLRYLVGEVAAELTRLSVEGRSAESVAIEEADHSRALRAVAALDLSARDNTSYQRFLVETVFDRPEARE
jgi:hypothetical protein